MVLKISFSSFFHYLNEFDERTSFHKGVFLGPEYFNHILGTNSHIKGTCIDTNFESNDLWFGVNCLLKVGGVILYQSYRLSWSCDLDHLKQTFVPSSMGCSVGSLTMNGQVV